MKKIIIAVLVINTLLTAYLAWSVYDLRRDTRTDIEQIVNAWNGLAAATIRLACVTRVDGIINFEDCNNQ